MTATDRHYQKLCIFLWIFTNLSTLIMVELSWCVVLFLWIFAGEELIMGLIRDAATEAVRDLVRGTVLYGGLSVISGAYHVT